MKFTISVKDLQKELSKIAGAISTSAVIPILEDFLFEIEGDCIKVTASDYDTFIKVTIPTNNSEGEGAIAIPAKILLETLKALPEQPITIDIQDTNIKLVSQSGEYQLTGEKADDYPDLPKISAEKVIEFEQGIMQTAINKTLFAVSNDELRPAMTGVFLEIEEESMTFVATDAHKLVKFKCTEPTGSAYQSIILPRKALALLKTALASEGSGLIKMSITETNVMFEFGEMILVCRLVDARYPDYNAVIPKENPNLLTINKNDLQNALRRLSIYSNKSTYQVILSLSHNELNIKAQDIDYSNEAEENLSCAYDGDEFKIAFSAKFMIDILNVIETEDITMQLSTPNRAGIIVPSENNEGEELLMLVMPIMINV